MIRSDRLFGLVAVLAALAYIASAWNLPPGNMFDALGPRAFPIIVGCGVLISALAMILRPDPEPDWPGLPTLASLALATVVLVGYAYALKPLGFLLPTAIAAGILSWQISGRPGLAAATGIGLSVGLFVIFRYALGLGLFALPRALAG